ncbi:DUF4476 domain-containing protein [Cytophagaceae bacterium YF14B1]|uniref:DUF4476 domain-containing protein n=1 Tax=Xanthocytophaga flava TaxID=3048013 RepID=A0AAE3QTP6_9BACT|nr:DUF4476 domain-containing protein [Xanthocytophaga flavus]MDJ1482649.1 DUF4476 domain-containing protein [Xanthocytophaga flavus]
MGTYRYLPVFKRLAFVSLLLLMPAGLSAQNGASGQALFQFLGSYSSQGVPNYLEAQKDVIDSLQLRDIAVALPESKPVPQFHPEYIAVQSETELKLTKEADVWVTFVGEMAGFRNVLGFYTYDLNNPPATADQIIGKTVIFPNVSTAGSGGGLAIGSKVKIGHFKANTGIGWFLIADGWKENGVGSGNYILYSNPAFNPESSTTDKPHTVLLHDKGRNKLILGFEDLRRDQGSDQDFNDVLFSISASPFEAIQKNNVISIASSVVSPISQPSNPVSGSMTNTNINDSYNTSTNNTSNSVNNQNTTISNSNSNNTTHTTNTNSNNTTTNTNSNNTNVVNNTTTIVNNNTTIVTTGGNMNGSNVNGSGASNNTSTNNSSDNKPAPGRNTPANPTRPGRYEPVASGKPNTTFPESNTSESVALPSGMCSLYGFNEADFKKTYNLIRSKPVEDVRVSTLRQAAKGRYLTIDQSVQLLRLLTVGEHRLETAKYLYDYSCERHNYFMVSQVLTTASHEREFNAFLEKKNPSVAQSRPVPPVRQSGRPRGYSSSASSAIPQPLPGYTSDAYAPNAFTDAEFEVLKSNVQQQSFSDTKLTIIQQAVKNRSLSTAQDIELMNLMSFEQDKLKLAKWLYDFTYDQQNYYKVNAAFSFSSTVDELNKYLNSK